MRISDWSSDVCSSDLAALAGATAAFAFAVAAFAAAARASGVTAGSSGIRLGSTRPVGAAPSLAAKLSSPSPSKTRAALRSEEHTSELQSLMRISYAVFCLKKKKKETSTHYKKEE